MTQRTINVPDELFPATEQLVVDFAEALAAKLRAAEQKYGYSNGWLTDDWEDECLKELHLHIAKGDPRDVALFCAFMWRRGWKTAPNPEVLALAEQLLVEIRRRHPHPTVER